MAKTKKLKPMDSFRLTTRYTLAPFLLYLSGIVLGNQAGVDGTLVWLIASAGWIGGNWMNSASRAKDAALRKMLK